MMKKYLIIKKLYFKTCIELMPKLGHPCVAGVITLHGEQSPPSSRSATKSSKNSPGEEKIDFIESRYLRAHLEQEKVVGI